MNQILRSLTSFFTCILLLASSNLCAQEFKLIDIVKLKNGHELKGEIVEYYPNDRLVFKFTSGLLTTIPIDQVEKTFQKSVKNKNVESELLFKERGMYHVTTVGASFNRTGGYSLTHAIGYRFNRLLSVGLGGGLENYEDGEGKRIVPLFLETRSFLLNKKVTPYASFRAGYGWGLENEELFITNASGGLHLSPEIGYRLGGASTVNVFIGVSMKYQAASFEYNFPWDGSRLVEDLKYKRYMVHLGIVF